MSRKRRFRGNFSWSPHAVENSRAATPYRFWKRSLRRLPVFSNSVPRTLSFNGGEGLSNLLTLTIDTTNAGAFALLILGMGVYAEYQEEPQRKPHADRDARRPSRIARSPLFPSPFLVLPSFLKGLSRFNAHVRETQHLLVNCGGRFCDWCGGLRPLR